MELALLTPVVLLIVLGAIDLGRAYLGWVVLNNAARVGANYAALHPRAWGTPGNAADQAEYEAEVRQARLDARITMAGCDTAAVPAPAFPSGTALGAWAEVTLTCDFRPITPIISDIVGNGVAVTGRSVFPIRTGAIDIPPGATPPGCPALADFTWQVDAVDPLTVHFTDASLGQVSGWIWNFGDAHGAATQNPLPHTYTLADTYTVTLSVGGCSSKSDSVTVSEPPPTPPGQTPAPTPTTTPTPTPACIVPGFVGTIRKNDAQEEWEDRGFTTTVQFVTPNPNGNWLIQYQSVVGGQPAPCNVDVTVGPVPQPEPT